jgi:hypothetical protein
VRTAAGAVVLPRDGAVVCDCLVVRGDVVVLLVADGGVVLAVVRLAVGAADRAVGGAAAPRIPGAVEGGGNPGTSPFPAAGMAGRGRENCAGVAHASTTPT